MHETWERPAPLERMQTGVQGLDTILFGGFLQGSSNLVLGGPGSGKTILSTQIAFYHVARGGRVIYLTMLSEPHSRLLAHISNLSFFQPGAVPERLYLVSVYQELEQGGLDALSHMIRRIIREHKATLAVLDGLTIIREMVGGGPPLEKFLNDLQATFILSECTALLLSSQNCSRPEPEQALFDSVIHLGEQGNELRVVRELSVIKLRGSGYLRGRHTFKIDDGGVKVFPRLEALIRRKSPAAPEERAHLPFGIKNLDQMLKGGILSGSTTTILGASGSGKTLLGLAFLAAGAKRAERGMYYGFYEAPPRLLGKADSTSLGLRELVKEGLVELCWELPMEGLLDEIGQNILQTVKRREIKRFFLDGIGGLRATTMYEQRIPAFLTALASELRAQNVTTFFSEEIPLFSLEMSTPAPWLSALVENIILLRYVEKQARLRRILSILKVREQEYDSSLREFTISERGIEVADTPESAEEILNGSLCSSYPQKSHPGPRRWGKR